MIKSPMNYTGGKYKLLPQLLPLFPKNIRYFVDVFCGGANVCINVDAEKIIANDIEHHVISWYKKCQTMQYSDIYDTIQNIIEHYGLSITTEEPFYKLRDDYNNENNIFDRDIMFFALICYSFNNQFRFNRYENFNMPSGRNRSSFNASIEKNLKYFHEAITTKDIVFTNKDFNDIKIDKLNKDDFVYCDPPYLITCATYNERGGWNETKERQLLEILDRLNDNGIHFGLSNVLHSKGKTNDLLVKWCERYNVHHLDNTYANCSYNTKDKTSKPDEVLITNF